VKASGLLDIVIDHANAVDLPQPRTFSTR